MVRLKVLKYMRYDNTIAMFQFLMVRLKGTQELELLISERFQFLMVRLKVSAMLSKAQFN